MNLKQAREIFEREVMASLPDCAMIEADSREFPRCFAFFYQSKEFVETGDYQKALVGHGHVLIGREDGRVFETGSAFSLEHYVQAFNACGDPLGVPTTLVKILDWHAGANKVGAINSIRTNTATGLAQAKAIVDSALARCEAAFHAPTVADAKEVVLKLNACGFVSIQIWGRPRTEIGHQ